MRSKTVDLWTRRPRRTEKDELSDWFLDKTRVYSYPICFLINWAIWATGSANGVRVKGGSREWLVDAVVGYFGTLDFGRKREEAKAVATWRPEMDLLS